MNDLFWIVVTGIIAGGSWIGLALYFANRGKIGRRK